MWYYSLGSIGILVVIWIHFLMNFNSLMHLFSLKWKISHILQKMLICTSLLLSYAVWVSPDRFLPFIPLFSSLLAKLHLIWTFPSYYVLFVERISPIETRPQTTYGNGDIQCYNLLERWKWTTIIFEIFRGIWVVCCDIQPSCSPSYFYDISLLCFTFTLNAVFVDRKIFLWLCFFLVFFSICYLLFVHFFIYLCSYVDSGVFGLIHVDIFISVVSHLALEGYVLFASDLIVSEWGRLMNSGISFNSIADAIYSLLRIFVCDSRHHHDWVVSERTLHRENIYFFHFFPWPSSFLYRSSLLCSFLSLASLVLFVFSPLRLFIFLFVFVSFSSKIFLVPSFLFFYFILLRFLRSVSSPLSF